MLPPVGNPHTGEASTNAEQFCGQLVAQRLETGGSQWERGVAFSLLHEEKWNSMEVRSTVSGDCKSAGTWGMPTSDYFFQAAKLRLVYNTGVVI
jgi:hypothetical protein